MVFAFKKYPNHLSEGVFNGILYWLWLTNKSIVYFGSDLFLVTKYWILVPITSSYTQAFNLCLHFHRDTIFHIDPKFIYFLHYLYKIQYIAEYFVQNSLLLRKIEHRLAWIGLERMEPAKTVNRHTWHVEWNRDCWPTHLIIDQTVNDRVWLKTASNLCLSVTLFFWHFNIRSFNINLGNYDCVYQILINLMTKRHRKWVLIVILSNTFENVFRLKKF